MLSSESKEIIEDARNVWCYYILEGKPFTANFEVESVFNEFYALINEPAPITFDGKPSPKPSFKTYATQINFINLLDAAHKNNVALDDELTNSDEENSVSLIIRKMEDEDIESRYNFHWLMSSGKQTYLVDSTPYPKDYYGFWLGANYEIKQTILPSKYKFNIVVENRKRSLKDTYKDPKNTKHFTDIIKGMKDYLKMEIFSSSKKEALTLKKYGIYCKHVRGSEVEGVQSDRDYTLITRLPLQNLNSDKYREAAILEMTNYKGSHNEYIYINAFAELLQASFRTAKIGKPSGSYWMSMDDTRIPTMKKYWSWLNDILYLTPPKNLRVADKIDYAVQGLTLGKVTLTKSERIIAKKILAFFETNPKATVKACLDSISENRNKVHKVLKYLLAKDILKT